MVLPPRKEREQIMDALARWFISQDIGPDTAAFVMSTMVGRMLCEIFSNPDQREMQLKLLISEMSNASDDD